MGPFLWAKGGRVWLYLQAEMVIGWPQFLEGPRLFNPEQPLLVRVLIFCYIYITDLIIFPVIHSVNSCLCSFQVIKLIANNSSLKSSTFQIGLSDISSSQSGIMNSSVLYETQHECQRLQGYKEMSQLWGWINSIVACTQPYQVQSLASQMLPQALPGLLSECRPGLTHEHHKVLYKKFDSSNT